MRPAQGRKGWHLARVEERALTRGQGASVEIADARWRAPSPTSSDAFSPQLSGGGYAFRARQGGGEAAADQCGPAQAQGRAARVGGAEARCKARAAGPTHARCVAREGPKVGITLALIRSSPASKPAHHISSIGIPRKGKRSWECGARGRRPPGAPLHRGGPSRGRARGEGARGPQPRRHGGMVRCCVRSSGRRRTRYQLD